MPRSKPKTRAQKVPKGPSSSWSKKSRARTRRKPVRAKMFTKYENNPIKDDWESIHYRKKRKHRKQPKTPKTPKTSKTPETPDPPDPPDTPEHTRTHRTRRLKRKHRKQRKLRQTQDRDKREDEETKTFLRKISKELKTGVSPEDLSGIRGILKHGIPGGD